ncbi:hypothetical protein [Deinococcus peraridilitoris]|uniref:Uncharacterized protein n=1 Tax=Deinococcus peraridilitoris (strain DSM 19664 / LMG 22246 / CIP 109416 / KR-200) TaxID=937777 RepID=L0A3L9_DEIPD|nr:hypothetical protein [Deinococcus peraridilitoris]AFZ67590.1 hypothetical protein Deipe_2095 [Deinococcus peraridilitoris DSM 19664]
MPKDAVSFEYVPEGVRVIDREFGETVYTHAELRQLYEARNQPGMSYARKMLELMGYTPAR